MSSRVLAHDDVCAGDVLLCFSHMMSEELQAAGTGYSHSAIALTHQRALEAAPGGVRIVPVARLLEEYDHVAVLRNAELWDQSRLNMLELFAEQTSGRSFNATGLKRFPERKARYQSNLMERVAGFFEGTAQEVLSERNVYFCSELVTAAFIYVGIIAKSAAVVFTPETFSPSDLGGDKAFGYFHGYLKSYPDYKIPDDDHFKKSS